MGNNIFGLVILLSAMAIAFNLGYNLPPSPRHLAFSAPAITDAGKGNLVGFEIFYAPGKGRTLVNIQNAAFREDVESALRKARLNADRHLGIRSSMMDLVLEVKGEGSEVSGESAGGMFAVAIIALQAGRQLREDVAISATIAEDGKLQEVGGIEEKIIAARENGRKVFLVSGSQAIKEEEELGGIRIVRVDDLGEAVAYLIK